MKTVDAQRIFEGVEELWHGQTALSDTTDWPVIRGHIDLALGEAWNSEWWQFLMRGEWRLFRDLWSATTTYGKTDEVYDAATRRYFQCLRDAVSGSGNSPTDAAGDVRSAYWAECKTSYAGSNWASGSAYVVGDIIFYPVDDQYYQCHTAHTASASLTPDATGSNERWGVLTPFARYVDFEQTGKTIIGDVMDCKTANPRITHAWASLDKQTIEDRVYVRDNVRRVWVDFRLRRPDLTGSAFSTSATYAVGDQVYFTPAGGRGNFYTCITATTAGQSPTTHAEKWSVVEIPHAFLGFLIWSAFAKALTADDEKDERATAMGVAEGYLALETDRIYRQAGETPNIPIRTYP